MLFPACAPLGALGVGRHAVGRLFRFLSQSRALKLSGSFGFRKGTPHARGVAGMSIPELLAVIIIIAGMAGLGAAAMNGLFRSTGRRAAVEQVMGVLEQARMKALASGRAVYVAFADASFPEGQQWKALALYEEGDDPTVPAIGVTRWNTLPGRMAFGHGLASASVTDEPAEARSFRTPHGERSLPYLKFNAAGAVEYPTHAPLLYIGCPTEPGAATGVAWETIKVALFTGRATFLAGRGAAEPATAGLGVAQP